MRIIILFYIFIFCFQVKGQDLSDKIVAKYNSFWFNNPSEAAFITTGRKIYFSGNSLLFSLLILDQYLLPSGLSKIAHLELIHESGKYHERFVLQLEDGVSNSKINIPYDAPSGNYQLVAYTNFMKNFDTDLLYHRIPIYIQNTQESIREVVKSINFEPEKNSAGQVEKNKVDITILHGDDDITIMLNVQKLGANEYFLVSEGLESLQFIANLKIAKNRQLSFKKNQFKGAFQKIVLIDSDLNVVGARSFFIPHAQKIDQNLHIENDEVNVDFSENLIHISALKESYLLEDSIDLFRRYYQLYYKTPPSIELGHLSYSELTSNERLAMYSKYAMKEWTQIMRGKSLWEIELKPEKEVHLRGNIVGDLDNLNGCVLDIHFFNNQYEIQYPLNTSGLFDLQLIVPHGKDSFFASIINDKGVDVSKEYKISFITNEPLKYYSDVELYDKSFTDSVINNHIDFNYILSTFDESIKPEKQFWSNVQIDLSFKPSDYRDMANFEEFLKEAVAAISIVKRDGKKELRLFNKTLRKPFEEEPVIVLNEMIISGSETLFALDLKSIKSIKLITKHSSLAGIGSSFRNGVLIVNTQKEVESSKENRHRNFINYPSYHLEETVNRIGDKFSSIKIIQLSTDYHFKNQLTSDYKDCDLVFQSIKKDGSYQFFSKKVRQLLERD